MNYEQFDKELDERETRERIMRILELRPVNLNELSEETGLVRTALIYQINKLKKQSVIIEKKIGKSLFYGLKSNLREIQEVRER